MRYDRNILIPYLKSASDIEFAYQSLAYKYRNTSGSVNKKRGWNSDNIMYMVEPVKPEMKDYHKSYFSCLLNGWYWFVFWEGRLIYKLGLILFVFFTNYYAFKTSMGDGIHSVIVIICMYTIISLIYGTGMWLFQSDEEMYNDAMIHYSNAYKKYVQYQQYDADIDKGNKQIRKINEELEKIKKVRDRLYEPNIIPKQFRNLESTYYLYEYFSTSQADDLDMIIQTLLLTDIRIQISEILNRLNNIIQNQYDMMRKLEDICSDARKIKEQNYNQLKRIANIESNQELQTSYMQMIEADANASSYFSAATCLIALDNRR